MYILNICMHIHMCIHTTHVYVYVSIWHKHWTCQKHTGQKTELTIVLCVLFLKLKMVFMVNCTFSLRSLFSPHELFIFFLFLMASILSYPLFPKYWPCLVLVEWLLLFHQPTRYMFSSDSSWKQENYATFIRWQVTQKDWRTSLSNLLKQRASA